jgi:hypothetical protein
LWQWHLMWEIKVHACDNDIWRRKSRSMLVTMTFDVGN